LGLFLRRRLGNELLDNLVEPLLAGIYAGDANQLSLQATFPEFQKLESEHRSLILAVIQQRKQARKRASQAGNPAVGASATRSGQGNLPNSMFLSLRTGLSRMVEALTERLQQQQVELRAKTGVCEILPDVSGTSRYQLRLSTGATEYADLVILASPAYQTKQILDPALRLPELEQIPYVSVSTILLAYPKQAVPYEMDASGFVVPRKEKRMITACTWVSSKWLHTAPDDHVLLRCYVGRAGDQRFLDLSDEDILLHVRADLKHIMGIDATPSFTRVVRWKQAMPQYLVGHLDRMQELENRISSRLPGVFLTGAAYHGLGVPDCIRQAKEVANRAIGFIED
jgi:protoporphyrinogen/coproporphyrinogen III oxidase